MYFTFKGHCITVLNLNEWNVIERNFTIVMIHHITISQ
jgi:hypothetical protein